MNFWNFQPIENHWKHLKISNGLSAISTHTAVLEKIDQLSIVIFVNLIMLQWKFNYKNSKTQSWHKIQVKFLPLAEPLIPFRTTLVSSSHTSQFLKKLKLKNCKKIPVSNLTNNKSSTLKICSAQTVHTFGQNFLPKARHLMAFRMTLVPFWHIS